MKKDGEDREKERIRYSMKPEVVKRLVMKDKELLSFDFTEVEQYSGESTCDISLSVIDGTGKAYESEFKVSENYSQITDRNTNKKCNIKNEIIRNVSITDGKVELLMETTSKFNNSLKFMYYVEV